MEKTRLVVIGGGVAGISAAAKARRCDEGAEIAVYEKNRLISCANCGLPYYLSSIIADRRRLRITDPQVLARRYGIDFHPQQEVIEIHRATKTLTVLNHASSSQAIVPYDRLVIAAGSVPNAPTIPGLDYPFVFHLKNIDDTDRIHALLSERTIARAVVIGGGLVGIEVLENLAHLGIELTLIEQKPYLLNFLDPEMAEIVQRQAIEFDLALYLQETVTAIRGENGRGTVETDQGRSLPADLVILATGTRPKVRLAAAAGLRIGVTGGLQVNEFMQSSDPEIFAAGDCIESINLINGLPTRIPMGNAANKQGRTAGANAMGQQLTLKGFTGTTVVKFFDLTVAKTGLSEKEARAAGFDPLIGYLLNDPEDDTSPDRQELRLKTVADRRDGRLLGGQIIGEQGVEQRINVLATALYNRMKIDELLQLDLAYAPPYSPTKDPLTVAGALGQNFFAGAWQPITAAEVEEKRTRGTPFLLLDLREEYELRKTGIIPGARHLPLELLRQRWPELPPEAEIILYCSVGRRAYLGQRLLALQGFANAKTLVGGLRGWPYGLEAYRV